MGWFKSNGAVSFSHGRLQYSGQRATDNFYYFDLPPEATAAAIGNGLAPSPPPPPEAPQSAAVDEDAIVARVTKEIEQRLSKSLLHDVSAPETPASPT